MHGSISGLFCLSTLILDQVLNGGLKGWELRAGVHSASSRRGKSSYP